MMSSNQFCPQKYTIGKIIKDELIINDLGRNKNKSSRIAKVK